jgi:hypothetical protein
VVVEAPLLIKQFQTHVLLSGLASSDLILANVHVLLVLLVLEESFEVWRVKSAEFTAVYLLLLLGSHLKLI